MYIPFASLLTLQAALESFGLKQHAQEPESITPVHFINPKPGGGSFLDRDSGGLGEPLNVSPSFGRTMRTSHHVPPIKTKSGHYLGTQLTVGSIGRRLCALRERHRLVSGIAYFMIIFPPCL